jgi:hypothetical protein
MLHDEKYPCLEICALHFKNTVLLKWLVHDATRMQDHPSSSQFTDFNVAKETFSDTVSRSTLHG